MDLDRFYSDENVALYRLLSSTDDATERRTILRLLAAETAKVKSELQQSNPGGLRFPDPAGDNAQDRRVRFRGTQCAS